MNGAGIVPLVASSGRSRDLMRNLRGSAEACKRLRTLLRVSISMSTLGLRIHLGYNAHSLGSYAFLSLLKRSLHSLRCYARPNSPRSPTLHQLLLRGPVRRSGSLSKAPAPPATWVDRLPQPVRPYLYLTRIDKPIGTLLLYYPCSESIPRRPDPLTLTTTSRRPV